MKKFTKLIFPLFIIIIGIDFSFGQDKSANSEYPKIIGYLSVVHPIITFDKNGNTLNFDNSYTVGFPTGINILKNEKFGYSLEIVPFINNSNGNDKVNNVLFHPGLLFRYPKNWTLFTRMAFETSGRYGVTPSISKVVYKTKSNNFFVSMPVPLRFGNQKPASIGIALQMGLTF
jgi:hypothetical protein